MVQMEARAKEEARMYWNWEQEEVCQV